MSEGWLIKSLDFKVRKKRTFSVSVRLQLQIPTYPSWNKDDGVVLFIIIIGHPFFFFLPYTSPRFILGVFCLSRRIVQGIELHTHRAPQG